MVTSDADFTRLATRIREDGLTVVGFGSELTPRAFTAACDKFNAIETLHRIAEKVKAERSSKQAGKKGSASTANTANTATASTAPTASTANTATATATARTAESAATATAASTAGSVAVEAGSEVADDDAIKRRNQLQVELLHATIRELGANEVGAKEDGWVDLSSVGAQAQDEASPSPSPLALATRPRPHPHSHLSPSPSPRWHDQDERPEF